MNPTTKMNEPQLEKGGSYLVQTKFGINELYVIRVTDKAVHVRWIETCNEAWLLKRDFESIAYGEPDIKIIEKL